jgi:hypothetical protein
MENKPKVPKIRTTLALTQEAQNVMLDNGYCGVRGMGEFFGQLVIDCHARQTRKPTPTEIATELHRLADLLESKRDE